MDSKQRGYIIAALRKVWLFSKERALAKKRAKGSNRGDPYVCAMCCLAFKDVQVDHVVPVGKFIDWNTFMDRLFCEEIGLQVLCKDCHLKKSAADRSELKVKSV